ncbi:hypothetical protein NIB75_11635 [Bacteroides uniformis]|nr:hypothetical protein [Bacteroides uniformis]
MVKAARYKAVMAFEKYCKANGLQFKKYLKCTPVVMLRLLLKGFIPHGLKLRSISQDEFTNMMQRSKATFDFANHKQTGYTMRFMENLCRPQNHNQQQTGVVGTVLFAQPHSCVR